MNSPGSAWTPVLAGLRQLICRRRENPKLTPTSYTLYRTGTKYRSGQDQLDAIADIGGGDDQDEGEDDDDEDDDGDDLPG